MAVDVIEKAPGCESPGGAEPTAMMYRRAMRGDCSSWVWALVLAPGLGGCIVSVDGLTGGVDGGLEDASIDSAVPATDATDSAKVEAGAHKEAGAEAAACVPFAPPDGGSPLACPPADAGTCAAVSLKDFAPHWIPPHAPMSACTSSQISMLVTCLDSTTTACNNFLNDAANVPCIQCMFSDLNAGSYGPILLDNDVDILNVPGCIALTQPCQMACAYVSQAIQQCHYAACASCPLDSAGLTGFQACTDVADTCSCMPEAVSNNACSSALADTASAGCFPLVTFNAAAEFAGKVFCGAGP
jgi:hypothetical protein